MSKYRLANRRPLNEDGTVPSCNWCGALARKHVNRNRWFATCGDRACSEQLRLTKAAATKQAPDHRAVAHQAAVKAANTKRTVLVGDRTLLQATAAKIKAANSQTGDDGLTGYERASRKAAPKVRASNEIAGNWSSIQDRSAFDQYRTNVRIAQRKFFKQIQTLDNFALRGPSGQPDAFHLDHRISLWYGFTNGVSPEHIGHICNLQMKPWLSNNRKWSNCDMSIEELLEKIAQYDLKDKT